ncbi:MAG: mitochondrial fission ELM1 family protein [bacterium]|nr:mitochondrial fission ELM1 family protein [bacterium]
MKILVLNDGFKGNLNQSLGIAQAFHSTEIEILDVKLKGPVYRLPFRKGSYPLLSKLLSILCVFKLWRCGKVFLKFLLKEQKDILKKEFTVIISAGSILAPVNLILARGQKAISVNIMVPSIIPLKLFDFAVIPYHDFIKLRDKKQKNLIVTLGAPNCITEEMLKKERKELRKVLTLPEEKEIIGILIGGNDQNYTISIRWIKELFRSIEPLKSRYNFIITTSRRTEKEVVSFILEKIQYDRAFIYAEFPGYSKRTFYPGILSLCRYILVTEDSINMVSEAATSGSGVLILGVERRNEKRLIFDKTLEKLIEKGYAEYLPVDKVRSIIEKIIGISNKKFNKLNEAEECAQKILQNIM